jgi:hypothetical protein
LASWHNFVMLSGETITGFAATFTGMCVEASSAAAIA